MHYYCVPTHKYKVQSYTDLQENIFFTLLVELTNTFEVSQVFRPEVLDKLTKKQMLSWQDFSYLADPIHYRIKTPSLREWETFDCYSWM